MDAWWTEYAAVAVMATLMVTLLRRRARAGRLTLAILGWMLAILFAVLIQVVMARIP